MAFRKIPLVTGEIYHIYNRSVAKQPIFKSNWDCKRLLDILNFYRFNNLPMRFSFFYRLPEFKKSKLYYDFFNTNGKSVDIFAFSLMPNHFHLLVKQNTDEGISHFIGRSQNSYAKYFNTKYSRTGALFQEMFKAVRIEDDNQFLHVSRYIHLNPITGHVLKNIKQLDNYPWTSYRDYISEGENGFTNTKMLKRMFSKKRNIKDFTKNQIEYQKNLDRIKHLIFD